MSKNMKVVKLLNPMGRKVWGLVEDGKPHNGGGYYRTKKEASEALEALESVPEYPGHCTDCGTPCLLDMDQNSDYHWYCPVCKSDY